MYEKWSEDMLRETRRKSRRRQKITDRQENNGGEEVATSVRALTTIHLQGPILLLLLCLALATLTFAAELLLKNTRKT